MRASRIRGDKAQTLVRRVERVSPSASPGGEVLQQEQILLSGARTCGTVGHLSQVLLRIEPADYARLVSRRRKASLLVFLLCATLATVIIVIEYRLMLISFVVMFPALVAVLDAVMVSRAARAMGLVEVRCDEEWISLNQATRLRVDAITVVRVQPDMVTLVEQLAPQKFRGHLLAVEGAAQQQLLAKLASLGCTVKQEEASIARLTAFIWGALANLVLEAVAGVLVLGAVLFTLKGFVDGSGPGWEALACFGGAVLALTVMALVKTFALKAPPS